MIWLLSLIAVTGSEVQARMDEDASAGKPLVAHVLVALADNEHQGIVPTSNPILGDGQSPKTNLYWGALYGVRTHLPKQGWKLIATPPPPEGVLERVVFMRKLRRGKRDVTAYVVADAWDGRYIQKTIERFLRASAGEGAEEIAFGKTKIRAGAAAHLVAYVGHNGLMDLSVTEIDAAPAARRGEAERSGAPTSGQQDELPKSSIVLACASKPWFEARLERAGAHPLLLTTSLMAPEAYTLHAALMAWFSGSASPAVHDAASRAYAEYQKTAVRAGKRLFWSAP